MARKAAEPQSKPKTRAASPKEKSAQKGRAPKRALATEEQDRIISTKAQRDIAAVCLIIVGIVLLVMVAIPSNALITSAVSTGLKLAVGVASFILPFILIAAGVSLLIRFGSQRVPIRVTIGLMVVFIALTGLMSLFTPGADANPRILFNPTIATALGGYLGAGIAFAGLSLFGTVISAIILIGIAVIGIIIIGFSFSQLIEKARQIAGTEEGTPEAPFARVRMAMQGQSGEDGQIAKPRLKMTGHKTQVIDPADKKKTAGASLAAANTQVLEKSGDQPARRRNTRVNAADTIALSGTEKPMTRKLGKASKEEAGKQNGSDLTQALPKQAVGKKDVMSAVATPRPADGFTLPDMSCLAKTGKIAKRSEEELAETGQALQETLEDFGIMATVVGWVAGPTVTLFKVELPAGVRVSRVTALNNDIALALAAPGVRIFAPIPGTNYVGIEVPNKDRQTVLLGDVLEVAGPGPLQIAIGKDVEGNSIVSDLAKMPHLLIGGTTGSGKSVSINAMIMSILMRATPAEVRLIMIDPKRVEFTPYNGIPHLYVPVVTEPKEASSALSWGVAEMERRLKVFSKVGARNIGQYNAKVQNGELEDETVTEMPYIVIIIDELADLMMNVGKEVEYSISRIAQLARAAGIHLIVATQRPSANVVTGLIKANITNRIAFNVATGIDSRVILDTPGAENLIGLGDLLLSKPELPKPQRIQGCYVSESEINQVVEHLKSQGEPEYHSEILKTNMITLGDSSPDGSGGSSGSDDPLIWEAADIVVSSGLGSTSNLQRRLKVGYARAGRIMDELEEKGVVGPANGSKPREVLVDAIELETLKAFEAQDE